MSLKIRKLSTSLAWTPAKINSATLTFIFLLGCSCLSADLIEKTVAIVNGEPILLSELKSLEGRLSRSGMVDDLLLFDSTLDSLKKNPSKQLQFLINEKILDSEVKRHNLTVTMERVDQEIRDIARRNNLTKEALLGTIRSQGISVAEYQDFMKQRIERQSVVEQEITSKIKLSDEDILAFYTNEAGKAASRVQEYTIYHIFLSPEKGGAIGALTRAERVMDRLKTGESFEKVMGQASDDLNSGGLLGTFRSGEFSSEFEKAVQNLNVGDFSPVVKSRTGYHILKLSSKKIIADPEFEKNKERYRSILFEKVFKRQFSSWLEMKKDEASIKLN